MKVIASISWIMLAGFFYPLTATASDSHQLTKLPKPVKAPDFVLKDIDGKSYRLSAYKGKVVIVSFWTSWCPPCAYEMPAMNRAWKKTSRDKLAILAVNLGESEDDIFNFNSKYPVDFPLLMDRDGSISKQWNLVVLPTTLIIGPKGYIHYRAIGGRAWDHDKLLKQILALLKN